VLVAQQRTGYLHAKIKHLAVLLDMMPLIPTDVDTMLSCLVSMIENGALQAERPQRMQETSDTVVVG
jgi:hypothetical protein